MRVVTAWASRKRLAAPQQQQGPAPASAVQLATRPVAHPARRVARILAVSPALATVRDLARCFDALVRDRCVDALTPWLAEAEKGDLHRFAAGLCQDEQAVRAALKLRWSSGQVEGQVSRLKLIKRQGCGRAGLDLLRARLIDAA